MICKMCPNEVHPERIAAQPNVLTCSAKCADDNLRELQRAAARRYQARQRAKKQVQKKTKGEIR